MRLRLAAARELEREVAYRERGEPGYRRRFLYAIEVALGVIVGFPRELRVRYAHDVRTLKVPHFPYRILYVLVGEIVDVVAIAREDRPGSDGWRRARPTS